MDTEFAFQWFLSSLWDLLIFLSLLGILDTHLEDKYRSFKVKKKNPWLKIICLLRSSFLGVYWFSSLTFFCFAWYFCWVFVWFSVLLGFSLFLFGCYFVLFFGSLFGGFLLMWDEGGIFTVAVWAWCYVYFRNKSHSYYCCNSSLFSGPMHTNKAINFLMDCSVDCMNTQWCFIGFHTV